MKEVLSQHRSLALFFLAYYLFLIAYGAAVRSAPTTFYAVFVIAAASVVAALYTRCRFSTPVLWGLALWGLGHMIGGIVEVGDRAIYQFSFGWGQLRFDKVVHFGFGFATLAAYELLRGRIASTTKPESLATAAWFIGLGIRCQTSRYGRLLLPNASVMGSKPCTPSSPMKKRVESEIAVGPPAP